MNSWVIRMMNVIRNEMISIIMFRKQTEGNPPIFSDTTPNDLDLQLMTPQKYPEDGAHDDPNSDGNDVQILSKTQSGLKSMLTEMKAEVSFIKSSLSKLIGLTEGVDNL
ncbi:hypothetical protein RF11_10846 [Thelohanellus kitauei]|uniref:Uncharacterized protein n=1 Tax=Thelohanellus kitauei TaxID=669202 RepID=A0A0C2MM87_THEKT|nr:hypothetical protein RF11_05607 [Thelohanellus kitauei]KII65480.1 hypothetical protein RF11_10846 [Thelohanellus kitauei]